MNNNNWWSVNQEKNDLVDKLLKWSFKESNSWYPLAPFTSSMALVLNYIVRSIDCMATPIQPPNH